MIIGRAASWRSETLRPLDLPRGPNSQTSSSNSASAARNDSVNAYFSVSSVTGVQPSGRDRASGAQRRSNPA